MSIRKICILFLCLLLSCSCLCAARERTIVDMTGREVALDGSARRVVALTAADCEILCALGAGDTLVGRGEYCDYPAEVLEIPAVASGYETNLEQIIALAPDLVLMGTMDQPAEQVNALEKAGISVLVSDAHDIEGVYRAIEMIGAALGKETEAEALTESMRQGFAEIAAGVRETGKTVYFEVSP